MRLIGMAERALEVPPYRLSLLLLLLWQSLFYPHTYSYPRHSLWPSSSFAAYPTLDFLRTRFPSLSLLCGRYECRIINIILFSLLLLSPHRTIFSTITSSPRSPISIQSLTRRLSTSHKHSHLALHLLPAKPSSPSLPPSPDLCRFPLSPQLMIRRVTRREAFGKYLAEQVIVTQHFIPSYSVNAATIQATVDTVIEAAIVQ